MRPATPAPGERIWLPTSGRAEVSAPGWFAVVGLVVLGHGWALLRGHALSALTSPLPDTPPRVAVVFLPRCGPIVSH